MSLSVDPSTASAGSSSSSSTSSSSAAPPQVSATTKNLENLLVQYASSESSDVQAMVARVASQLGVNVSDVRAAAKKDAEDQAAAGQAAAKVQAAADAKAAAAATAVRKRQAAANTRRAAEAYRRHRLNEWASSYARASA